MKLIQSILIFAGLATIAGSALVLGVYASPRIDKYLELKALHDCAISAQYEFTKTVAGDGENLTQEEVTTTTEPIRDFYRVCVDDKGYSTNW